MDKHLSLYVQFLQHKYLFILPTEYILRMIIAIIAINSPYNSHLFVFSMRWNLNFYVMVLFTWVSREREMVQAVSCRLLIQFTEIRGEQSGTRTGFSPSTVYVDLYYTFLFIYFIVLSEGRKGEACSEIRQHYAESFFIFYYFKVFRSQRN